MSEEKYDKHTGIVLNDPKNEYRNDLNPTVFVTPIAVCNVERTINMKHETESVSAHEDSICSAEPNNTLQNPTNTTTTVTNTFTTMKEGTLLFITNDKDEKPYVVSKVIDQANYKAKDIKLNSLIDDFIQNQQCFDSPLSGFAAREVLQSDVDMMHIKEVEDNDEEPLYELFGNSKDLELKVSITDPDGSHKVNCKCKDCEEQDECDEYLHGPYCVAAVKRYYEENKYNASQRCAYQVFVAHYNRVLDYQSHDWYHESKGMRQTEITKPTYCMKEGSLKYALFWVQWKIENGPEKDWYTYDRQRKKRAKMYRQARKASTYRYRYTGNEGK